MQKFWAKYAQAAHLAILAVAPLALYPFVSSDSCAAVLLWLSLFSAIWLVAGPSCRAGEGLGAARERVCRALARDPILYLGIFSALVTGFRALNGGIASVYDLASVRWTLASARWSFLPGCVSGAGALPFAVVVAATVLILAVRHSLGRRARQMFAILLVLFAGVTSFVWIIGGLTGIAPLLRLQQVDVRAAGHPGLAFALLSLLGLGLFAGSTEEARDRRDVGHAGRAAVVTGLVGTLLGTLYFASARTFLLTAAGYVLLGALSFVRLRGRLSAARMFHAVALVTLILVLPILLVFSSDARQPVHARLSALATGRVTSAPVGTMRPVLAAQARQVWRRHLWYGAGVGAFPLAFRHLATEADFAAVPKVPSLPFSAYEALLAERGIVGATLLAAFLLLFLADSVRRLWLVRDSLTRASFNALAPVVLSLALALGAWDPSLLRADALLALASALTFSAGSLPHP